VRAAVLRVVAEAASIRRSDISRKISYDAEKIEAAIEALEAEGLIHTVRGGRIAISGGRI
jgi:DNA-binding MarR family transcriptional regulator